MKFNFLRDEFQKQGFKVTVITFLEDGYELRLKLLNEDNEEDINKHQIYRENLKKLDEVDCPGYINIDTSVYNNMYRVLLVPVSMERMIDFVWTYVEKHGRRDQKISEALAEAFCVLEKAIEHIPDLNSSEKSEAQSNFDRFSGMVY